ncbi:hypothetical protein N0V83_011027 [Neocucurbitaria cava]|uniref:AAA+ ATPase domain-containing protein n=1 Tax=Neocucurbitaria cava TaxID=798079 RepID=A0A9W9CHB3_9PLEO|nr:hypothetical protein N0V83_011027 [Neocucurbitaria cava]
MLGLLRYMTEDLTDDYCAIITPRLYGYALQERKWHALNIENITDQRTDASDFQNSKTPFDDLVLPKPHKSILRALISHQTRKFHSDSATSSPEIPEALESLANVSMNLVRGKGKGVIILLHGAPGVGKTSTAECVASQLGRPLFPITCGDLGVDASTVELRLEEYFRLASRWGCVLLLDEADVFLARHSSDQLRRNALVSGKLMIVTVLNNNHAVFLRVLEYYAGVLMLTTNRVGEFDEAFRSRIHISLYYPKLDKDTTFEIWDMNLQLLKRKTKGLIDIDEKGIKEFYEKRWKVTTERKSRR